MDTATAGTLVIGCLSSVLVWAQSNRSNRRSDFTVITDRLRKDLVFERVQRRLLATYVIDILKWAKRVGDDSPAGSPPMPPDELEFFSLDDI